MKPISNTAFYCCGARMHDAEREHPVCGDMYAKVFMNESGSRIYEAFKDEVNCSASMVARHRIIDDFLRQALSTTSDLCVITIGAGFDSRPYRFDGGTWVELDEPQMIAYKNERLPISVCTNQLHRVPIDFSSDSLEEKISSFSKPGPVVFVIEGVFIYLDENEIKKLLPALHAMFPKHKLICDLLTRRLIERYGRTLTENLKELVLLSRLSIIPK